MLFYTNILFVVKYYINCLRKRFEYNKAAFKCQPLFLHWLTFKVQISFCILWSQKFYHFVKETAKFPQSGRMPFPITQKQRLHGILLKSHEASAFISLYLYIFVSFIFLYLSPLFHRFEIPVRISGSVPSILDNLFCKICICIRSLDFFRFLFICIVFGIFSIVLIC